MVNACRYRRFLSRCGRPSIGSCQYCGLAFCDEHGSQCGETDQICVREICHRKHADLARHLVFRDRAWLRNRHGLCGIEGCQHERWGQCSKCQGLYCEQHLASRSENVRQGMVSFSRPASFCEHCLTRRKLWSRL
jgi:hypothetical protein